MRNSMKRNWTAEEEYRHLFQAIDKLPSRCREIFLLSLEGKKNKEIAEMLQYPQRLIKTQKIRAINRLKKILWHTLFLSFLRLSIIF